jgi:hypothetical protein
MKPLDTTNPTFTELTLKKETLRRLTAPELQLVVGGERPRITYIYPLSWCWCPG